MIDGKPVIWFLMFVAFCAGWVGNTILQIFRGQEVFLAGQKVHPLLAAYVLAVFLIVVGIFAAIQFGFITNYAS